MEKASFLDDTGDKAKALAAYGVVEGDEKTPGAVRIDCCLAKIRIGAYHLAVSISISLSYLSHLYRTTCSAVRCSTVFAAC